METTHRVVLGDARSMSTLDADSVDLVVTSPPYPLIEQWDDLFADLDPAIGDALADGDGDRAFALMHDVLDAVWAEVVRVLRPGGIACINVGDATRTVDGDFQSYPNHAEITDRLRDRGLRSLPDILWRKPTNSPNKFLGSGTLPPNAYPTLEHEHILVFRNGDLRSFAAGDEQRYESSFFWEERNEWFSDLWEITGESQTLDDGTGARERSAAFPLVVPLRLIRMFSVYGDTVLDPFWGTGTTTLAAMLAGRNSVGYEQDPEFRSAFEQFVDDVPALSQQQATERLETHREFVARREREGNPPGYEAENYDTSVVTKAERAVQLYTASEVADETERAEADVQYRVSHDSYSP